MKKGGPLPFEEASSRGELRPAYLPTLDMPRRHAVALRDVDPGRLESVLLTTYERAPQDFETLLGMEGVGARTLRALALVSEVIYGTSASMRDPARFAFAHGTVRVRGPSSQCWLVASLRDATRWNAVPSRSRDVRPDD